MRAAAQEGEIGGDIEFGVARGGGHHPKTPCRYQAGRSFASLS
jgi:hypothetical protein